VSWIATQICNARCGFIPITQKQSLLLLLLLLLLRAGCQLSVNCGRGPPSG